MRISDWSSDVCSSDLLADIETERQSWARRADEAKTHLAELEERLAATAAEIETLVGIPVALAEKRAALSELIDAAEARRRAAAAPLAQGETRLGGAHNALKGAEARLPNAREHRIRAHDIGTATRRDKVGLYR